MARLGRGFPQSTLVQRALIAGAPVGVGAGTFAALTGAAVGTQTQTATGAGTFAKLTGAATGTQTQTSTAAGTFAALTGAATGTQGAESTAAGTFAALTGAATGTQTQTSTAAGTFAKLTGAATGTQTQTATAAGTFAALTGAATGTQTQTATAAGTFAALTGAAVGTQTQTSTAAGTFAALTGAATGTAGVAAPAAAVPTGGRLPVRVPLQRPGQSAIDLLVPLLFPQAVVADVLELVDVRPQAEVLRLEVRLAPCTALYRTRDYARARGVMVLTVLTGARVSTDARAHAAPYTDSELLLRWHAYQFAQQDSDDAEALAMLGVTL